MTDALTATRPSTDEPAALSSVDVPDTAVLTVYEPGSTRVRSRYQVAIAHDSTFRVLD